MSSRHVQNDPPARCVRPRSARWNACECALLRPGSVTPRSRSASPRGTPGWTSAIRPSPTAMQHVGDDAVAAEPREVGVIAGHSAIGTRMSRSAATCSARS